MKEMERMSAEENNFRQEHIDFQKERALSKHDLKEVGVLTLPSRITPKIGFY